MRFLPVALMAVGSFAIPLAAQAPPPKPAAQAKPQPKKPIAPAPSTKPAAKPPDPAPAPPPAPQDVHFKSSYITGDQKTETVTFVKGARERFEFKDMVLLKQHDQKRTVQISTVARAYFVAPDDVPAAPVAAVVSAAPPAPPRPPGSVTVTTTIVDTGERKELFGHQARHVKTTIERQPMPGACDMSKPRAETDGWYIDTPKALESQALGSGPVAPSTTCSDVITTSNSGDPKALGFPLAYTTTLSGDDNKPSVVTMEVREFEVTTLDAAMFEIPTGLNAAASLAELGQAVSNANEAKLAAENAAAPAAPIARTPGVTRIGVPELSNKTDQTLDTRALRAELITNLTALKYDVVPLATASPEELQQRATERGLDYLLLAEVSELKVPKGGIGGAVRAASRVGSSGAAQKEPTEASVQVKLLQMDGKQKLSTTAKGKDNAIMTAQTGMGLARLANSMPFLMGPQMMFRMYRMYSLGGTNLGGMGALGNPSLFRAQSLTLTGMGAGRGSIDQTAGAASFIVSQAMAMKNGTAAGAAGAPSYDEALNEALDNTAKAVAKALEKK